MLQKGICLLLLVLIFFVFLIKVEKKSIQNKPETNESPKSLENEEYLFPHKSYEEIIELLKKWENKVPDLIDSGTYGKSTKGIDHFYIKITNEKNPGKDVVLLTACIHGNEPLSTSTMLGYVGKILSSYGKEDEMTKLLNEKTIYFIPVISPDTFGKSRHVDGVDPNRNFPTFKNPEKESVLPIENLKKFFLKIKPKSVLSGHTYGRVYLIPCGDNTKDNKNLEDYKKIASKMSELSDYDYIEARELYGRPIYGTEIDWYHRNKSFSMVMEFGTHQKHPSLNDTKKEFERTLEAVLFFIKESTKIEIKI